MNRKIPAGLLALLLAAGTLTACGGNKENENVIETDVSITESSDDVSVSEETSAENGDFFDPGLAFSDAITSSGNGSEDTAPDGADLVSPDGNSTAPVSVPDSTEAVIWEPETPVTVKEESSEPVMKEYNVDHTTRYGYNQLSADEKELYDRILEAVKNVDRRVAVDENLTDEEWIKVYGCMYMEEPELFWLSSKKVSKGKLWYWETDKDLIASMQKEIDAKVAEVLGKAEGKSDYDKIKVFHDYICLNNNFVKESGFNQTIYGGFVLGTIQCEGYAKTMQYLCDLSGIEAVTVVGANEAGDSHAWNVVKVDGEWYNIDSTWDDPILSNVDETNIRYRYFLCPDEWLHNKSHFSINEKVTGTRVKYFDPPACTSDKLNYFNVTNQVYSDFDSADAALKAAMTKAADSRMRAAEIRVSDKSIFDQIKSDLKGYASWIKSEKPEVTSVADNCDPYTLVIELDLVY